MTSTPGPGPIVQCGGRQYQGGYCCNGFWFDPGYAGCPAGNYRFVASDGNDSNPGTENAPWRTVRRAADLANAGDVVFVKEGSYSIAGGNYFTPALNPVNSGTAERPIIFRSYPGHRVAFSAFNGVIGGYQRQHLIWDGFVVSNTCNCKETPVPVYGSYGITVKNCEVIGQYDGSADNHAGIFLNDSRFTTILNNRIHGFQGPDPHSNGILTYFVYDTLIENNEIYDSVVGVSLKGGPSDRTTVRKNLMHDVTVGVWIIDQTVEWSKIYQNIVANCREGVFVNPHRDESIRNFDIYNNLFHRCSEEGVNMWANADQTPPSIFGFHFWNNIFSEIRWPFRLDIYNEDPRNALLSDYNNFYGASQYFAARDTYNSLVAWQQGTGKDQASMTLNPGFVSAQDYHLSAASLLRNAGVDLQDHDGDSNFNEAINLGPYIEDSETIGIVNY